VQVVENRRRWALRRVLRGWAGLIMRGKADDGARHEVRPCRWPHSLNTLADGLVLIQRLLLVLVLNSDGSRQGGTAVMAVGYDTALKRPFVRSSNDTPAVP
jgi:hypothetical protein